MATPNDETQALLARIADGSRVPEVALKLLEILPTIEPELARQAQASALLTAFVSLTSSLYGPAGVVHVLRHMADAIEAGQAPALTEP